MDKLGVTERSIDPISKALLLDGHATHPNVTFNIKDRHGIVAPAQGRLVLVEIPGKGPQVHIEPRQLKTSITPPKGLNMYTEDIMRLHKTGMANRPVVQTDPATGRQRAVLVGYDPVLKKLHLVDQKAIRVPQQVKGQFLNEKQQQDLRDGKQIVLRGLKGEDNKPYAATLQFSAAQQQFRLDRIGKKQTETIQMPTRSRSLERDTAQGSAQRVDNHQVYLKPLTEENNKKWLHSTVEVQTANLKTQTKKVKDLTYEDAILVRQNGTVKTFMPLTMKPVDNVLQSPAEQARLHLKVEKKPPIGGVAMGEAKPHEIEKAKASFTTQTVAETSVVTKNGASRTTQNQTANTKPVNNKAQNTEDTGQPGTQPTKQTQTRNGQPVSPSTEKITRRR